MQIEIIKSYRQKLQAPKADHLAGQMTECFQKIIAREAAAILEQEYGSNREKYR